MPFSVCRYCGDVFIKNRSQIYCARHSNTQSTPHSAISIRRSTYGKLVNFKPFDYSMDDFINALLDFQFGNRLEYCPIVPESFHVKGETISEYRQRIENEESGV